MRRSLGLVFFSVTLYGQDQPAQAIVRQVVQVEKSLPWFFTPHPEGIRDVPYAYEWKIDKQTLNSKGEEVLPPKDKKGHYKQARSLHFEHIPLKSGYGWETKCISQDHVACGPYAWDVPPQKTPEEFRKARDKRRSDRIALWDEFLRAFRFENAGPGHVRFAPTGTYKHSGAKDSELFEKIQGELFYDSATFEITRLQFELIADVGNLVAKLYKGTIFKVELAKLIDNYYLPVRWSLKINKRMLTSKGAEETETEYSNYRKFETSSTIIFEDPR